MSDQPQDHQFIYLIALYLSRDGFQLFKLMIY